MDSRYYHSLLLYCNSFFLKRFVLSNVISDFGDVENLYSVRQQYFFRYTVFVNVFTQYSSVIFDVRRFCQPSLKSSTLQQFTKKCKSENELHQIICFLYVTHCHWRVQRISMVIYYHSYSSPRISAVSEFYTSINYFQWWSVIGFQRTVKCSSPVPVVIYPIGYT